MSNVFIPPGLGLPQSVLDLVELSPVEDILLTILRQDLPDVPIVSLVPDDIPQFFVLVRRITGMGNWQGDSRFTDEARFIINTLTADPDGDEKGALLSEAVRVVLRNAWLAHRVIPGKGSVIKIEMTSEPSRQTDWTSSSGPVQYADLPTGYWRYSTTYQIQVRKPR